jgi:hypothetical protein
MREDPWLIKIPKETFKVGDLVRHFPSSGGPRTVRVCAFIQENDEELGVVDCIIASTPCRFQKIKIYSYFLFLLLEY